MTFAVFIEKDGVPVVSGEVELLDANTRYARSDYLLAHFSHQIGAWVVDECLEIAVLYLDGYCCGKVTNYQTISV